MSDVPTEGHELADGLARFLADEWGGEVAVDIVSVASAGARRANVLFDAVVDDRRRGLVATIIPAEGMQLVPVATEVASLERAGAAGVPVPRVVGSTSDPGYVGGSFFVTERVAGETIGRQILRMCATDPALGPRLADGCGVALARLHALGIDDLPADLPQLHEPTPTSAKLLAQVEALDELLQPSPTFAMAHRWLELNDPGPGRPVVVHGDLRNGNIVVGPNGLTAVLDWEVSHTGDPMEDLAWLCVRMWRFRNDRLPVGGFARVADLRGGYERAGGEWLQERFRWWLLMGTVRWGIGLSKQAVEHLDGTFPSIVMAASGRRAAEMEYDALMLLESYA